MSGIFGILGLSDTERVFASTIGQAVIYDGAAKLLQQFNAELMAATRVFIEETTPNFAERYKSPGGGRLQRRGGLAPSGAVKAYGGHDVGYPLEDWGAQLAENDIVLAYWTMQDVDRHLTTVMLQAINTFRFELLRRLYKNTTDSFGDPLHGTLTIQPLANGDAVLYPPVLGSETEATENHYLVSGYVATAISDVNNPFPVIRDDLEHHFGASQGGGNIAVFIHPDERPEVEALSDFDPLNDPYVVPGANVNTLTGLPAGLPGRLLGRCNNCWVQEWRWITTGYAIGLDLDAPAPLKMRVDPADTGLGTGLQLVATDQNYPLQSAHYRYRFGLGAGNRLNGVVMQFAAPGAYAIPAAYAA